MGGTGMPRSRLSTKNDRAAGFQTPRRWNLGVSDSEFEAFHWAKSSGVYSARRGFLTGFSLGPRWLVSLASLATSRYGNSRDLHSGVDALAILIFNHLHAPGDLKRHHDRVKHRENALLQLLVVLKALDD